MTGNRGQMSQTIDRRKDGNLGSTPDSMVEAKPEENDLLERHMLLFSTLGGSCTYVGRPLGTGRALIHPASGHVVW